MIALDVLRGLVAALALAGSSSAEPAAPAARPPRSQTAKGAAPTKTKAPRPTAAARPRTYAFDRGASTVRYLIGANVHVGDGTVVENATVELRGARIHAVSAGAARPNTSGAETIDLTGRIVTPGLIAADTTLGLIEIDAEKTTDDSRRGDPHPIHAAYDPSPAIQADGSLVAVNAIDGITSAASTPRGGLIAGQVAWIDLTPGDHAGMVTAAQIAVTGQAGQAHADSRAATLAKLREVFADARFLARNAGAFDRGQSRDLAAHPLDLAALRPVLDRRVPLVLTAHRVSEIRGALALARELGLRLVIVGATQAWRVADELALAKVPVVIQPSANLPEGFDRIGARMDHAALLEDAGVEIVIAVLGDAHNVRNVKQEAGLAVAHGLSRETALSAITRNAARAYGMDGDYGTIAAGKVANLVVWGGDPLELSTVPERVFVRGKPLPLRSRQTLLRDRYLQRLPRRGP